MKPIKRGRESFLYIFPFSILLAAPCLVYEILFTIIPVTVCLTCYFPVKLIEPVTALVKQCDYFYAQIL
jgi:hypothetical protein